MYFIKVLFICTVCFVSLSGLSQTAGYLDDSFGTDGVVVSNLYDLSEVLNGLGVYADGRIITGGAIFQSGNNDFVFAQYAEDGSLDESFSDDGKLILNYPGSDDFVNDLVIQEDQKVVAVGTTINTSSSNFAILRLNNDGTLDNTFSSDGIVTVDIGDFDYGRSVALQEDGKIVVAGYTCTEYYDDYNLAMCRLNSDGSLDNTFGNNGKVLYDVNWEMNDYMNDVVIYEGDIFVSGYCDDPSKEKDTEGVAVVKFTSSGQVDYSFGEDGTAFYELGVFQLFLEPGSKMAINQNGIYLATRSASFDQSDMAIINLLHNGYPNDGFGNHGLVVVEMVANSRANSILLQPNDKIVVGGSVGDNAERNSFIARFLPDGEFDIDFGTHFGATIVDITPGFGDNITAICMQSDQKIVAAGTCNSPGDFALARFYSGLEVGVPESYDNYNLRVENPVTDRQLSINFHLENESQVVVQLFDMTGANCGVLFNKRLSKGEQNMQIDMDKAIKPGVYIMRLQVNDSYRSIRLLVQ